MTPLALARRFCLVAVLASLSLLGPTRPAFGKKIDTADRPAFILSRHNGVLALEGEETLALYGLANGKVIRRFVCDRPVKTFAPSPDQQFLLAAERDGTLGLWFVATGERLWSRRLETDQGDFFPFGVRFSGDGKRYVVWGIWEPALWTGDTAGKEVRAIRSVKGLVHGAALSRDGSRGTCFLSSGQLLSFDAHKDSSEKIGEACSQALAISADGNSLATVGSAEEGRQALCVAPLDEPKRLRRVGSFSRIDSVIASDGGNFLFTASRNENGWSLERWDPERGQLTTVVPDLPRGVRSVDPHLMLGVRTDFALVTELWDLREGKIRWQVDNSANARESVISDSARGDRVSRESDGDLGFNALLVLASASALVLFALSLVVLAVWIRFRPRSSQGPP